MASHYDKVLSMLEAGKDSIFEPCKILKFHRDRMTAEVFFTKSRQRRDNVLVAFPSLFLNTGIIAPPVKNSTAIAFWGADKEPIVLPAQFLIPKIGVEDGMVTSNASPNQIDDSLDLVNVEGGELLLRALGGSYVFVKNMGEVEIATSKLHRLSITESDGALNINVERVKSNVGGLKYYNGPYVSPNGKDTTEHHIQLDISDRTPILVETDVSEKELVDQLAKGNFDVFQKQMNEPIFKMQMANVFNESGQKIIHPEDQSELFLKSELIDNITRMVNAGVSVSKDGTIEIKASNRVTFDVNGTKLKINEGGDITFEVDGEEYSAYRLIRRFRFSVDDDVDIDADRDLNFNVERNTNFHVDDNTTISTGSNMELSAHQDVGIFSQESTTVSAGLDVELAAGRNVSISSDQDVIFSLNGKAYSLTDIIQRINVLGSDRGLEEL